MNLIGIGKATGKVILIGEHTVVFGEPAIALPFYAAQVETRVYKTDGPLTIACDYFNGNLSDAPESIKGIQTLIYTVLAKLHKEPLHLHVDVSSKLPPRRGLGSSASVSVSIVRALYQGFECQLDDDTLSQLVHIAEEVHHFNPSGLDANTITKGKPIYFRKHQRMEVLPIALEAYLVVADTGDTGHTKRAVQKVASLYDQNPREMKELIERNGELTQEVSQGLCYGSAYEVGRALNESQSILSLFGISNARLDKLVETARHAGAVGSKLTGSGMGGCMIALCDSFEVALNVESALRAAGAKQTWQYNLKEMIG